MNVLHLKALFILFSDWKVNWASQRESRPVQWAAAVQGAAAEGCAGPRCRDSEAAVPEAGTGARPACECWVHSRDKQPEAVWRCRDWAWIISRSSIAGWTGCYWQKGKGGKEFLLKCSLNYFTSITLKVSFEQKGIIVWKQSSLVLSSLPWRLTLEIIIRTDKQIKAVFMETEPWSRKTFRWKRNQCSCCGLSEERRESW